MTRQWWFRLVAVVGLGLTGLGCNIEHPFLLEPRVYASPTEVFLAPPCGLFLASRAGLFYFTVPDNVPAVSYPLTKIFYQELLKNRVFYELSLIPQTFSTQREALAVGRAQRYDLILLGQVPYFLDSGTTSKSGLQVHLRVLEVKSGDVVCALSDAIGAEPSPMLDLVVWDSQPKPSPSIYALSRLLAERLCQALLPPFRQDQPPPTTTPPLEVAAPAVPPWEAQGGNPH